jgi:hypothetical protein
VQEGKSTLKTEVYSWRVSPEIKTGMEQEARRRRISLSAALDLAAEEWLAKTGPAEDVREEQIRLQNAASACFGVLANGNVRRSENERQAVRQRLQRRQHQG